VRVACIKPGDSISREWGGGDENWGRGPSAIGRPIFATKPELGAHLRPSRGFQFLRGPTQIRRQCVSSAFESAKRDRESRQ